MINKKLLPLFGILLLAVISVGLIIVNNRESEKDLFPVIEPSDSIRIKLNHPDIKENSQKLKVKSVKNYYTLDKKLFFESEKSVTELVNTKNKLKIEFCYELIYYNDALTKEISLKKNKIHEIVTKLVSEKTGQTLQQSTLEEECMVHINNFLSLGKIVHFSFTVLTRK